MGEDTFFSMSGRELVVTKFAVGATAAQGQTSGADQVAPAAYGAGANGLSSGAEMTALLALVVEIRTTLVNNGMMKGGA